MNYAIGIIAIGLILFVFAFGVLITNPAADKKVSTARNSFNDAAQHAEAQSRSTVDAISKNVTSIVINPVGERGSELVKLANSTISNLSNH